MICVSLAGAVLPPFRTPFDEGVTSARRLRLFR
jgi:hypothetical protein